MFYYYLDSYLRLIMAQRVYKEPSIGFFDSIPSHKPSKLSKLHYFVKIFSRAS